MIASARLTQETMTPSPDRDCETSFMPDGQSRPQFVPAPLDRPSVDPAEAGAFGRPVGVPGAFADQQQRATQRWTTAPPPPDELVAALGRPGWVPSNCSAHPDATVRTLTGSAAAKAAFGHKAPSTTRGATRAQLPCSVRLRWRHIRVRPVNRHLPEHG
jgi:hypothetical protein